MSIFALPLAFQNHSTIYLFEPSRQHFIHSSLLSSEHVCLRANLRTIVSASPLRAHISDEKCRLTKKAMQPRQKKSSVCQAVQESIHATDGFYSVLGVSKDVNPPELKKAYRKLALQVRFWQIWDLCYHFCIFAFFAFFAFFSFFAFLAPFAFFAFYNV